MSLGCLFEIDDIGWPPKWSHGHRPPCIFRVLNCEKITVFKCTGWYFSTQYVSDSKSYWSGAGTEKQFKKAVKAAKDAQPRSASTARQAQNSCTQNCTENCPCTIYRMNLFVVPNSWLDGFGVSILRKITNSSMYFLVAKHALVILLANISQTPSPKTRDQREGTSSYCTVRRSNNSNFILSGL